MVEGLKWLERMNQAVEYLEENLANEISYEEAAKRATCSTHHFQRMFSMMTDIPVAEYVRRRRLTLSAQELQSPDMKILDIALKYGYESPDSFTRAFQRLHGILPSAAREQGITLKAYPRISFYLLLKGDMEMDYKIVEKQEFKVFGKTIETTQVEGQCFGDIKRFLDHCHDVGVVEKIRNIAGYGPRKMKNEKQVFQIMFGHKPDGKFNYMVAAEQPKDYNMLEEFEVMTIPKATYAVFSDQCKMSEAIGNKSNIIWKSIPEWFDATGYEYADSPSLEIPSYTDSEKIIEIWVPIIKK